MKNAGLFLVVCFLMGAATAQSDSTPVSQQLQGAINHHASRYAFAPSAYPVPKGGFYYQNYNVLANDVQIGITENASLGMGYGLPLFAYMTPKISTALTDKVRVGLGDLAATSMFLPSEDAIRLRYVQHFAQHLFGGRGLVQSGSIVSGLLRFDLVVRCQW
jgi:hypothetical protein